MEGNIVSIKQKFSVFSRLTQKRSLLLLVTLAFVLTTVGGGIFSPKAHATDPNLVYGTWPASDPASFTTAQLRTDHPAGTFFPVLEVRNNFYHFCGIDGCSPYHWKVWEFQTDHWVVIKNSGTWHANGVMDIACYVSGIRYGYAYKVTFYDDDLNGLDGEYWIIGHEHASECPSYL